MQSAPSPTELSGEPGIGASPPRNLRLMNVDWPALVGAASLAAAAVIAYARVYSVPLLFDDESSIASNPTLRHLGTALWPPVGATVGGRPFLNLSLAANYAVSGTATWSYHAVNLAIHILAGLTLFGIIRRTLAGYKNPLASPIAFAVSLLWTLHPLQTESVTYVVQRAESLMGLLYLLTLYCFIRGAASTAPRSSLWYALSVGACLLGMATKEVMVSAPLIVLLYDRTFLAGSFRGAWRLRRRVYAWLAATWVVLFLLVISSHGRGGSAGFGTGMSSWSYARTQLPAIVHYLGLCFWPSPLVFYYGDAVAPESVRLLPSAIAVTGLLAATAWALVRRPVLGFLGAFFFAVLAPSSSFVPVATETMAEHRMYLPLISVLAVAVLGMSRWLGRATLPVCLVLAAALMAATLRRNEAYLSEYGIWSDTVAKRPGNEGAHNNLGKALAKIPGHQDDAVAQFQEAIRLKPDYAEARNNLATLWSNLPGRLDDAIAQFQEAIRLKPDFAEAHYNLGAAWLKVPGRLDDAVAQYEEAIRLSPGFVAAHNNLGVAMARIPGRQDEAIAQYGEAIRLDPGLADAHDNLGEALAKLPGRMDDAAAQYREAIRLRPDFAEAHDNLGILLSGEPGRLDDAAAQYQEAIRLKPDFAEAHNNLAMLWSGEPGRLNDAVTQYEEAIRLRPDFAEAHYNLGAAWFGMPGRLNDAIAQFGEAIRLDPSDAAAHNNLGTALGGIPGRMNDAVAHFEEAIRLRPDYADAHFNLGAALAQIPGRLDDAIVQYEEAIRLKPEDPEAHFSLAVALSRMPGHGDEERTQLEAVLRLQPANEAARRMLAHL
jgi:protein O-mannosyl-transferase